MRANGALFDGRAKPELPEQGGFERGVVGGEERRGLAGKDLIGHVAYDGTASETHRPMPFVYLLRCSDGSLYTGWTTDVERRVAAHNAGTASRYTRSRRPVAVAAVLPVADRSAALREEARIKRLRRGAKQALIDAVPLD
jgi:putative endonuclease